MSHHDYFFWVGDFNFRANIPFDEAAKLANDGNIQPIFGTDQLAYSYEHELLFYQFQEGEIKFRPTYRRDRNLNSGVWSNKKNQSPSYTDRIFFYQKDPHPLEQLSYTTIEDQ